jgi:hypothetical protein
MLPQQCVTAGGDSRATQACRLSTQSAPGLHAATPAVPLACHVQAWQVKGWTAGICAYALGGCPSQYLHLACAFWGTTCWGMQSPEMLSPAALPRPAVRGTQPMQGQPQSPLNPSWQKSSSLPSPVEAKGRNSPYRLSVAEPNLPAPWRHRSHRKEQCSINQGHPGLPSSVWSWPCSSASAAPTRGPVRAKARLCCI